MAFEPMMAPALKNFRDVIYPIYIYPSIVDGVRCLIRRGAVLTHNMKALPNKSIRADLHGLPDLDGVLMPTGGQTYSYLIGDPDATVNYVYMVFDCPGLDAPYQERLAHLQLLKLPPTVIVCKPFLEENKAQLQAAAQDTLELGFRYAILRDPTARYHNGMCPYMSGIAYLWDMRSV